MLRGRSETPCKVDEIRQMAKRSQRKPLMSKSGKDIDRYLQSLTEKIPKAPKRSVKEPEEVKSRASFSQPRRKLKSALKHCEKRELTPY